MSAKLCLALAAVLLIGAACTASAAECYAFHTGYKSSIPLGAFSIYGGCIKGTVGSYAGIDNLCLAPGSEGGTGNYATRAACCAALEPEVKGPNPMTMQPRPENKNIKELCLAGRKITDQELKAATAAPAAAPAAAKPAGAGAECYAVHTGYKTTIPLGAFSVFGGCIKGTVGSYAGINNLCLPPGQDGGSGNYATRAACCAALEPMVQGPDPQSKLPRPENINIKALCMAGKAISDQELKAVTAANQAEKSWVVFKGQDLVAAADLPDMSSPDANKYVQVCRGLAGTAAACKSHPKCVAFTFGGDGDCGYLKLSYVDAKGAPQFKASPKWSTYVLATQVNTKNGGTLDCVKTPANVACKATNLPKSSGTQKA